MSRTAVLCACALACMLADARAERAVRPDLSVRALPPPTSLRMRRGVTGCPAGASCTRVARAGDARDAQPGSGPGTMQDAAARIHPALGVLLDDRPLSDKVVFRFSLGMGFDGGQPSDERLLSQQTLDRSEYAHLRIYYFGDAVIGSRGLLAPSLSTYLAAQFRMDEDSGGRINPVPTVFDGDDVANLWIRSAHAQLDGVFDHPLLAPVWVRAGRQYRYGPAIAHYDGLTVGYDGPGLTVAAFAGRGVNVTGSAVYSEDHEEDVMVGLDGRIDLHALRRVPLVLSGGLLRFHGTSHVETSLALRWSRDVSMSAGIRILDGSHARTRLDLHARVSKVTTVSFELDNRSITDWMYDLFTVQRPVAAGDPRPFLDLGEPVPRLYLGLRAGTVLLGNVDVLVHGGAALRRHEDEFAANAHAASFAEAGTAIEVRLRRTLAMGLNVLVRRYEREEPLARDLGQYVPGTLEESTGAAGELSFLEGGAQVRYDLGARRFSASTELYWRRYHFQPSYIDLGAEALDELASDVRGGARFGIEAWAGERLRLRGEYDVSSALRVAPELRGVKSLRIVAEGRF